MVKNAFRVCDCPPLSTRIAQLVGAGRQRRRSAAGRRAGRAAPVPAASCTGAVGDRAGRCAAAARSPSRRAAPVQREVERQLGRRGLPDRLAEVRIEQRPPDVERPRRRPRRRRRSAISSARLDEHQAAHAERGRHRPAGTVSVETRALPRLRDRVEDDRLHRVDARRRDRARDRRGSLPSSPPRRLRRRPTAGTPG